MIKTALLQEMHDRFVNDNLMRQFTERNLQAR